MKKMLKQLALVALWSTLTLGLAIGIALIIDRQYVVEFKDQELPHGSKIKMKFVNGRWTEETKYDDQGRKIEHQFWKGDDFIILKFDPETGEETDREVSGRPL